MILATTPVVPRIVIGSAIFTRQKHSGEIKSSLSLDFLVINQPYGGPLIP